MGNNSTGLSDVNLKMDQRAWLAHSAFLNTHRVNTPFHPDMVPAYSFLVDNKTPTAGRRVTSIPRSHFDGLFPANRFLESIIGNEVEWFTDAGEFFLGTVADGLIFDKWTYVLLGRGGLTGFHILSIDFALSTRDEATVRLLRIINTFATPAGIALPA